MFMHITVPVFVLVDDFVMAMTVLVDEIVFQQQVVVAQYFFIISDSHRLLFLTKNKHTIRNLLGKKQVVRYDEERLPLRF